MADVKYRIEGYDFYDTDGMARHLEKMAADGWMIESINGIFYKYRRCEKQNVAFAATYFVKTMILIPTLLHSSNSTLIYAGRPAGSRCCSADSCRFL